MKNIVRKLLFLGVLILAAFIGTIYLEMHITKKQNTEKACFNQNCFTVQIASTQQQMFREYLDENSGMLFVFDQSGEYPFWMKNTLIPLDIIWVNNEKKVVFIHENAEPCGNDLCIAIDPHTDAKYVLELNAGAVEKINLKVGDSLQFGL